MKNKTFLLMGLLLLLLPLTLSLEVYVRPPRIVARMNVTPGETSTYEGFLEVKNQNDFPVNVTLEPQGSLKDKVQLTEDSVSLDPDELRAIDFTINVKQPGTYQDIVLVTYRAEDTPAVGLQAEIIVLANEVESEDGENRTNIPKYGIIGFIFLVIIIVVLILLKRRCV
ncbi:MAG: hypothetical protein GF368_03220 [Candidatus Aenigmarchaeota archaeon]|nr:hypothetical protein [Candidatus Aenigmarchaeota archaeon]